MLLCCGWQPACATLGFYVPERLVVPSESSYYPAVHVICDVRVNGVGNPQYLEVRIKVSKTDRKERCLQGVCPVAVILGYIVRRGQANGPFLSFQNAGT